MHHRRIRVHQPLTTLLPSYPINPVKPRHDLVRVQQISSDPPVGHREPLHRKIPVHLRQPVLSSWLRTRSLHHHGMCNMKIAHTRVPVALEQVLQRSPRARPACAYLPHSATATHVPYCSTPREVHTCIFSLNFLSDLVLL